MCVVGMHAGMCACSLVCEHMCMGMVHISMQMSGVVLRLMLSILIDRFTTLFFDTGALLIKPTAH